MVAELVVGHRAPRDADDGKLRGQTLSTGQLVNRGQQLPARQIAGCAEDDERRRIRGGFDAQAVQQRIDGVVPSDRHNTAL